MVLKMKLFGILSDVFWQKMQFCGQKSAKNLGLFAEKSPSF